MDPYEIGFHVLIIIHNLFIVIICFFRPKAAGRQSKRFVQIKMQKIANVNKQYFKRLSVDFQTFMIEIKTIGYYFRLKRKLK